MGTKIDDLTKALALLNEKHEFKVGDFVVCKDPTMANKNDMGPDDIKIVVEVYDEPLFDHSQNAGSVYFHEPLDLVLGEFQKEGIFICYHHDSRRFKPYVQ